MIIHNHHNLGFIFLEIDRLAWLDPARRKRERSAMRRLTTFFYFFLIRLLLFRCLNTMQSISRSTNCRDTLKVSIIDAIKAHPMLKPSALSRLLGKPKSMVCKSIRELIASGALHRDEKTAKWLIVQNQV